MEFADKRFPHKKINNKDVEVNVEYNVHTQKKYESHNIPYVGYQ